MFCRNCGAQLAENAAFCSKCGSPVIDTLESNFMNDTAADSQIENTEPAANEKKSILQTAGIAFDKAIGWEHRDLTIAQMAEKIRSILPGCSSTELARLNKLANKTWILAVGGGSSLRPCVLQGKKYILEFDYSLLTRQISKIYLLDYTEHVQYDIPRGGKNARTLQVMIKQILG